MRYYPRAVAVNGVGRGGMAEQESVSEWERLGVDTSKPSVARVYDAILGGKDNFAVDRAVAAKRLELIPDGGQGARISRGFLARGVAHMAREGITQFLDIGSGLPTSQNTLPQTSSGGAPWSPSPSPLAPGWSTSTTTRSCWPTRGRCSPRPRTPG